LDRQMLLAHHLEESVRDEAELVQVADLLRERDRDARRLFYLDPDEPRDLEVVEGHVAVDTARDASGLFGTLCFCGLDRRAAENDEERRQRGASKGTHDAVGRASDVPANDRRIMGE